jgi:hypothetical protein
MASPRNYRHARNRRPRQARAPKSSLPLKIVGYMGNSAPATSIILEFDRPVKAHSLTATSFKVWQTGNMTPPEEITEIKSASGCTDAGPNKVAFVWSGPLSPGTYVFGWDCEPNKQPVYLGTIHNGPNFQLVPQKLQAMCDII